ncbi:hypothetical protein DL96DRAFT_1576025 [Flagelloscypha sp. PMI_526]|nr:hypothetical protein DL96DRAFT_1576025 [Flagelloscypha sp. PMI_526]
MLSRCSRSAQLAGCRGLGLSRASFYTQGKPLDLDLEDGSLSDNDFILSILKANPSLRDTRSYLESFGPRKSPSTTTVSKEAVSHSPVLASILNPVQRRTALVKLQGPFTDRQLNSIARGLVYLRKLGLLSVIVVENDELARGEVDERSIMVEETMRVVAALEHHGVRSRPLLDAHVRLGPDPTQLNDDSAQYHRIPEAHTISGELKNIHFALRQGEVPVLPPFALDSFCRSIRVNANDVIAALAQGMARVGASYSSPSPLETDRPDSGIHFSEDIDMTPVRLMIINREGGVPSYARSGLPHLLVNLESEFSYIHNTFIPDWHKTHPTSLSNLSLARTCLSYMPPTASAVMVSHRSPSSLIGNLITNKPAVSSSLPHALLQGNRKLTQHTPTLLRHGLSMQVLRSVSEIDRQKLKALLELSFRRTLDETAFYSRLEKTLDFVIVAGDYAGAAIVTNEGPTPNQDSCRMPISYLDKFAVHPDNQGDGTVDFLWVALHDESYGLGHPFSANPNGGKGGIGEPRDLVWRSRANNPVNKWYFERSTGHFRHGDWVLFWCDAEKRLRVEEEKNGGKLSFIEPWESGRLDEWVDNIMKIPSVWKPL